MRLQRRAARWMAGLLVGGAVAAGALAPAQAATAHHLTPTSHHIHPTDTGWNGT